MAINPDFAPTFMEMAGLAVPADMQGRGLVPLLHGQRPADCGTGMDYRYYHDPGDRNTTPLRPCVRITWGISVSVILSAAKNLS